MVMPPTPLQVLADFALLIIVAFIPILWVVFTDRFRETLSPGQYVTLFALAAVGGILLFVPAISIISATALLALGLSWVSAELCLRGVTYERELTPSRFFPGDTGRLVIRIANQKLLPLAWLRISDMLHPNVLRQRSRLDEQLGISGGIEISDSLQPALVNRAAMGAYQEVERVYSIEGLQRGVYTLGPARMESGDPFGIFRREQTVPGKLDIIVYPRVYEPEQFGLPFRAALGSVVTRRSLYQDPTLLAGSREYRPGDPLRHVHWKATARSGNLQVRLNDPSTTAELMLVLNLNTNKFVWQGVDSDRVESVLSVAASTALWALHQDFAVGVRSNGTVAGTEYEPRIPSSAHPQQPARLLEHLVRLSYSVQQAPEYMVLDEGRRLGQSASMIFITSMLTPGLVNALSSRSLQGRVTVIYCGRRAAPMIRGLQVHLAVPPTEPARATA